MENFKFWVVRNPSKDSTLQDVLFEMDANSLANYAIGTGSDRFKQECHRVHATREQAVEDLRNRLVAIRDAIDELNTNLS